MFAVRVHETRTMHPKDFSNSFLKSFTITLELKFSQLIRLLEIMGAFHYAKDSGNFGRNSNGKVRFGFFRRKYSGSPLEVVHLFRLEFAVPFLTNRFFALIRKFGNDKKWQGLFLLVGAV